MKSEGLVRYVKARWEATANKIALQPDSDAKIICETVIDALAWVLDEKNSMDKALARDPTWKERP